MTLQEFLTNEIFEPLFYTDMFQAEGEFQDLYYSPSILIPDNNCNLNEKMIHYLYQIKMVKEKLKMLLINYNDSNDSDDFNSTDNSDDSADSVNSNNS
ncbi:hypothetical protein C2G38_2221045 [Gigaspora rosea]|uniref:Uncharacterized protein n=1 Tax=Gigaspora rosea TaxID=44941 RepID=A0A397U763_9GLOM|nr:hypothetical protein C2G38_2221045 [Gigaspora rosea]